MSKNDQVAFELAFLAFVKGSDPNLGLNERVRIAFEAGWHAAAGTLALAIEHRGRDDAP